MHPKFHNRQDNIQSRFDRHIILHILHRNKENFQKHYWWVDKAAFEVYYRLKPIINAGISCSVLQLLIMNYNGWVASQEYQSYSRAVEQYSSRAA